MPLELAQLKSATPSAQPHAAPSAHSNAALIDLVRIVSSRTPARLEDIGHPTREPERQRLLRVKPASAYPVPSGAAPEGLGSVWRAVHASREARASGHELGLRRRGAPVDARVGAH